MLLILDQSENVIAVLNNESPDACPYWNDKHIETLNNSLSTYEFEAPLQHASSEHIIADNYVARADMDGDYIFFKIKVVTESLSNGVYTKRAYCENAAISELNGAFIRPKTMTGWSAEDALDYVLDGTMWNRGDCDFLGAETLDFQDYPTSLAALHTIATVFGGELKYRVEIKHNVLYRYIDLVESRGTDTGKRFEYHKDINGLTRTEDSSNLATALIGLGKADANGKRMTFASINDGLDWVGDDDALDRYGQNGYHIFGVYESEYAENPVDLMTLTKAELNRRKKPFITYDVDVILLETLADWSHEDVRLGDTVRVLDLTFTPEVVLAARIVSLERSYIDHTKDRAILGEFVPLTLTVPSIVKKMQKTLVSNTGLLEGRELAIHVDSTPPTNLDQKWMDTSVVPNVLKRYDGSAWVSAGGEQGPPGPQGLEGPPGVDGVSQFMHIRYSANADGSAMTTSPQADTMYIGLATTTSGTAPTLNTAYTWSLFRGSEGVQGPAGADGATTYTWVRYADDAIGTNLTNIPDGKMYIGLAFNKSTPTESDIPTDYQWSAMYDLVALNAKAETADMDNLAKLVSDVGSQITLKADANAVDQLARDYYARLDQDILDKEQLAKDLATIEGRAILAETLAGDNKIVTDFINTVMTESEEGIYIANKASSTGILIATDRISFMDNNVEVAYISNQTMQINHGIFVQSATISGYKFECIPNTEILVISWVGG